MVTLDEKLINDEQKKIEECYLKLGEQYYAAHKDDDNAEFAELIGAVKASEKVIADHREEVRLAEEEARKAEEEARRLAEEKAAKEQRIKELLERELMPCPNCDAEIYYKSIYCNFCGIKIADFKPENEDADKEPEQPENEYVTVAPEQPVEDTVTAAPEQPVEETVIAELEQPVVEEPVIEEPTAEEPTLNSAATKVFEPAASRKVCANCGAALDDDCVFCTECGTPVAASAPKAEEAPAPAKDTVRFCIECGFRVTDPEAMFCNNCGNPLQPLGGGQSAQSVPKVKRCPNCGFNTTDPEVLFCIECGSKLV